MVKEWSWWEEVSSELTVEMGGVLVMRYGGDGVLISSEAKRWWNTIFWVVMWCWRGGGFVVVKRWWHTVFKWSCGGDWVVVSWWWHGGERRLFCDGVMVVIGSCLWHYSGGSMGQRWWWYVVVVRVSFGWYLGENSGLWSDIGSLGGLKLIKRGIGVV